MTRDNLYTYKQFKYLKWASVLCIFSATAYVFDRPAVVSNGGTPLGYTLGTIGALLIVWLMWLGVRKRQYLKSADSFKGWVSAHIYLGLSLITIATLHSGFQIGWNVHTLAYLLMMFTIASGVWGISLYLRLPDSMSAVLGKDSPDGLAAQIDQLDKTANKLLANVHSDNVSHFVKASLAQGVFNTSRERRVGAVAGCKTTSAVSNLQEHLAADDTLNALYQNQVQRMKCLKQLRVYFRYRYWLELWLAIHVPLSFGLLAALVAHVVSVFFYW